MAASPSLPRPASDSTTVVWYDFHDDAGGKGSALRDKYTNFWGSVDKGILLEDMDALSGNVAFRHTTTTTTTTVGAPSGAVTAATAGAAQRDADAAAGDDGASPSSPVGNALRASGSTDFALSSFADDATPPGRAPPLLVTARVDEMRPVTLLRTTDPATGEPLRMRMVARVIYTGSSSLSVRCELAQVANDADAQGPLAIVDRDAKLLLHADFVFVARDRVSGDATPVPPLSFTDTDEGRRGKALHDDIAAEMAAAKAARKAAASRGVGAAIVEKAQHWVAEEARSQGPRPCCS